MINFFYFIADGVRRYPGFGQRWEIPCDNYYETPETVFEVGTLIDKRVVTEDNHEFFTDMSLHHVLGAGTEAVRGWAQEWYPEPDIYWKVIEASDNFKYILKFESTFEYFADPSTKKDDADGDGLTDAEEYRMSNNPELYSVDGRALPTRKDIFVEVDWMSGHKMKDAAKWKVGTRFLNNPTGDEIWLHIDARSTPMNRRFICILGKGFPADDGSMGGGEEVSYDEETSTQEFRDIYDQNFADDRGGLFHYGVFSNVDTEDVDR